MQFSILCTFFSPPFLLRFQLDAVISFLMAIPDPTGQPAMCFVLNQWCAGHVSGPYVYIEADVLFLLVQSFFYGVYETRVSTLALCKLLNHCLTVRDSRLAKLSVRVEEGAMSEGNLWQPLLRLCTMYYCVSFCPTHFPML